MSDNLLYEKCMARYHSDSFCGSCEGPLEQDRDAICHKCSLDVANAELARQVEGLRKATLAQVQISEQRNDELNALKERCRLLDSALEKQPTPWYKDTLTFDANDVLVSLTPEFVAAINHYGKCKAKTTASAGEAAQNG